MFRKSRGDNEVVITALHQKSSLKLQKQDKTELSQIKKRTYFNNKDFSFFYLRFRFGLSCSDKKMMAGLSMSFYNCGGWVG